MTVETKIEDFKQNSKLVDIMNKMASIVSKTQEGAQSDMDMLEVGRCPHATN